MQQEFFPKTELDDANAVLNKLIADEEKAEKACGTADEKLSTIQWLIQRQRRVIAHLASEMPAAAPAQEAEATEEAEYETLEIEGDVLNPETEEAEYETLEIEGDVLNPETGEVRSAGEPISQPPHVFVQYPGESEVRQTFVGEHTTYSELVADYLSEVRSADEPINYEVVNLDDDLGRRSLDAVIVPLDYGRQFAVVPPASEAELAEHEAQMALGQ